jgi:hypothetical protein
MSLKLPNGLDVGSHAGIPAPVNPTDALQLAQLTTALAPGGSIATAITTAITTAAGVTIAQVNTAISNAVTADLAPGGSITSAIATAVNADLAPGGSIATAITTAITNGSVTLAQVNTAILNAVTADLAPGGSIAAAIATAVGTTVAADLAPGGSIATAIATAVGTALTTALAPGGSIALAISSAVTPLKFYDVAGGFVGTLSASQTVMILPVVRPFNILASGLGVAHQAVALTAATTTAVALTLQKRSAAGVLSPAFGTMSFAVGQKTATFSVAATGFAIGDALVVTAPASVDAVLADCGFTIAGVLP